MADLTLKLGDFEFGAYEVPTQLPGLGGVQAVAVHDLVGGGRVVDAMGAMPVDLSWAGLFFGAQALERARYVDSLRVAGRPLTLTWLDYRYQVVIANFAYSFMRFYRLPYQITCKVVTDATQPVTRQIPLSFDAAIMGDFNAANALSAVIGDGTLGSLMTTLQTAINAVSSFANAAQSTINSVLTPLQAVRTQIQTLITSVGLTVTNVTSAGGILATPAGLQSRMNNMSELSNLYTLDALTARMHANLSIVNQAPNAQTVTVTGGNLYALAAQYYNDPNQWTVIAQANSLTDPMLTGVHTLTIPPTKPATGGVPT